MFGTPSGFGLEPSQVRIDTMAQNIRGITSAKSGKVTTVKD